MITYLFNLVGHDVPVSLQLARVVKLRPLELLEAELEGLVLGEQLEFVKGLVGRLPNAVE